MTDVFIIGSKGIPAQYGGFETFVEKLTELKVNKTIKYHVSCMNNDEKHFTYNGADCFNVKVSLKGPAGRILHVACALDKAYKQIIEEKMKDPVVYILGCRIGPLMKYYYKKFIKIKTRVFVNPDGLEWKRDKWNRWEKVFLRYCERCLVQNSDLIICDSKQIQRDMQELFYVPKYKTTYIAYGAEVKPSAIKKNDQKIILWYSEKQVEPYKYYLVVGRFVPENNYETIITEFMKTSTSKDLVIITNIEKNKFYNKLKEKTCFHKDKRIKFVGTVYDQKLLKIIREQAYAYIHGHSVGGTNPSLLEALASTDLNILLDVEYNREVGGDSAIYFDKKSRKLSGIINNEKYLEKQKNILQGRASHRILQNYNWSYIERKYIECFKGVKNE